MLKHLALPTILVVVATTVYLTFASIEPVKRDTVAYESPQAAIAASFK